MSNNIFTVINIVIVICGLFFLLSTISSHIIEIVTGLLNSRGRHLHDRLSCVLSQSAAAEIYDHPIVKSFAANDAKWRIVKSWPAYIEPSFFAKAIANLFQTGGGQVASHPIFQQLAIDAAQEDQNFSEQVEAWFNALNDRLTGTYVRWTILRLIVFGFVLAALCDLDIIDLIVYLWKNDGITDNIASKLTVLQSVGGNAVSSADKDNLSKTLSALLSGSGAGDMPFFAWQHWPNMTQDGSLLSWVVKLAGWLMTAVATSLGAQFWFNLMTDALKLRATGKKPELDTADADAEAPDDDTGPSEKASDVRIAGLSLASFAASTPVTGELGSLSSKYEVGGRGPGTVSSGIGDPGGISYGSYQLSTTMGTAKLFATNNAGLSKLTPGTPAFGQEWRNQAKADPAGFQQEQHDFIEKTHYDVLKNKVRLDDKIDIDNFSAALRDVIWSVAVQHGGNSSLVHKAVLKLGVVDPSWMTKPDRDAILINAIYDERQRRDAQGNLVFFANSPKPTQIAVAQRFVNERRDALNMLRNEPPVIRANDYV